MVLILYLAKHSELRVFISQLQHSSTHGQMSFIYNSFVFCPSLPLDNFKVNPRTAPFHLKILSQSYAVFSSV